VDGFSNALLSNYLDRLDPKGQDYLQRVRAAAQRMAQLIDDILGLSRAGRVEMHLQRVDLGAIAAEILDSLRKSHPRRQAEVAIEPDMTVTADPPLLRIALDNLLGNAWKFTSHRDPASIQVGSVEQNGERVYFVRDNGAGFDSRYADKLFSPFQRLHTEAEFPGTGIGLALVQRIIRRHGGRIWAEGPRYDRLRDTAC
jgi:light-regulated signal transduction histidine kinase (bacteriophytochrome)